MAVILYLAGWRGGITPVIVLSYAGISPVHAPA